MLLLLVLVAIASAASPANLVMLTDPRARCMDGTYGGFYVQRNTTVRGGTRYVVHLQGGGECATKDACDAELTGPLGSSKYFNTTMWLGFLNDGFQTNNPDFYDATHVLIAYCSGDLWSGTIETQRQTHFFLQVFDRFRINIFCTASASMIQIGRCCLFARSILSIV